MNFKTFKDLNSDIFANLHKLPADIDLVAGIPRSGLLAANIIALYKNLPLTDIDSLAESKISLINYTNRKRNNWIDDISQARKILIVDDSVCSGASLNMARVKLKNCNFFDKIIFMAIYAAKSSIKFVDLCFDLVEFPRMFEWNYLHHGGLINACFDIDGVLCPDPTEEQNDDGAKYIDFIRNVPARVVPSYKIGYIITSRLEKYRKETERWLKGKNIMYGELIMMNLATKEDRIKSGSHGKFKAEHYRKIKAANIFIESNTGQAQEIAKLSGKMVFCTDSHEVYMESLLIKAKREVRKLLSKILPRKIKDFIKKLIA